MITGDIKSRVDQIWDTFWTGGITNGISVIEQMTYLFFMKLIDDAQNKKEANANELGITLKNPTFKDGMWHNPDTDKDVPYEDMRWKKFVNFDPNKMFAMIVLGILGSGIVKWIGEKTKLDEKWRYSYLEIIFCALMFLLSICSLAGDTYNPFIYFRF